MDGEADRIRTGVPWLATKDPSAGRRPHGGGRGDRIRTCVVPAPKAGGRPLPHAPVDSAARGTAVEDWMPCRSLRVHRSRWRSVHPPPFLTTVGVHVVGLRHWCRREDSNLLCRVSPILGYSQVRPSTSDRFGVGPHGRIRIAITQLLGLVPLPVGLRAVGGSPAGNRTRNSRLRVWRLHRLPTGPVSRPGSRPPSRDGGLRPAPSRTRQSGMLVDPAGIEPATSRLQGGCLPIEALGPEWRN